jgi:hypothetical protein
MPSYHGRQIRSAGLRMFSGSCSGRIVGHPEITRSSNLNFGAVVLEKRGWLNWSVQHYLEVYLPEFESPKFVAGVD